MPDNPNANNLEDKLQTVKRQMIEEVKNQTALSLEMSERNILSGIKSAIENAVETKYRVTIGTLGEAPKGESRGFEIFKILLPVALTAVLAYWVFVLQKRIEGKIEEQKQTLGARLALTQEYQKRKVKIYEDCAQDMSALLQGLELLRIDLTKQQPASSAVHDLYVCARNNALYVSPDVARMLGDVRSQAIIELQSAGTSPLNLGPVEREINSAEAQMKAELQSATVPLNPANTGHE